MEQGRKKRKLKEKYVKEKENKKDYGRGKAGLARLISRKNYLPILKSKHLLISLDEPAD